MIRWIASRLAAALITLFVASIAVFGSLKLVPGDPISAITSGARLTDEQKDALREQLGLNQDFITGYFTWFSGVLQFDFGRSFVYGSPVTDIVGARMTTSTTLVLYALLLTLIIGLTVALISALKPGVVDQALLAITSAFIATPSFIVALVLLGVFAVNLRWFPATGSGTGFIDQLYHLTLPAIAMALVTFGLLARVPRERFKEELASEHVEVARSRGVGMPTIVRRHVLRNSLAPIVTLSALLVSSLFIGAAVVETAFGVDGVGQLLVSSINRRDFPVVQAISLLSVTLFVVTSTIADLLMPLIDPRVRTVGATR